jgi:hypothetical protein
MNKQVMLISQLQIYRYFYLYIMISINYKVDFYHVLKMEPLLFLQLKK